MKKNIINNHIKINGYFFLACLKPLPSITKQQKVVGKILFFSRSKPFNDGKFVYFKQLILVI